jgi:Amt family ammonium transporter
VEESLRSEGHRRYGRADGGAPDRAGAEERASFERVGLGTLYRSGDAQEQTEFDDTVLGLHYANAAQRTTVPDDEWAPALRSFARAMVWCLPAAAIFLALSAGFGWPTADTEPTLVSPGTWVVVTAFGFALWLAGVVALAALAAASPIRPWGFVAVLATTFGTALLAPVVGAAGFARPAISRTAQGIANDPNISGAADQMQRSLLDNTVGRWLLVGGSVLLAIGAIAVVGMILGSRVLQRHDGWLVLIAIGLAVVAAYLGWSFLLTLGAMVLLAASLGLAYTVSRIAPDGSAPPAY